MAPTQHLCELFGPSPCVSVLSFLGHARPSVVGPFAPRRQLRTKRSRIFLHETHYIYIGRRCAFGGWLHIEQNTPATDCRGHPDRILFVPSDQFFARGSGVLQYVTTWAVCCVVGCAVRVHVPVWFNPQCQGAFAGSVQSGERQLHRGPALFRQSKGTARMVAVCQPRRL